MGHLKVWAKKAFHLCALLIICWGKYTAGHLFHIIKVHARQAKKTFCF